jgi:hypothetical protein
MRWRLEFPVDGLSPEQRASLLVAVGYCGGRWNGQGRAEFPSCEDAVRVVAFAAGLPLAHES